MNDTGQHLQLFAWHAEGRFLFIATTGGTYDLVKEQPISSQTLETIRRQYEHLTQVALKLRKWDDAAVVQPNGSQEILTTAQDLGALVRKIILHPDIRKLFNDCHFSEIVISTNEFSIPWEILSTGDSFIGLTCPVTRRLQSARPVNQSARVLFRSNLNVLIVDNPTGDLPGTDREAAAIETLLQDGTGRFDVRRLTAGQCTRLAILPLLSQADIFHYAGHGYFNPERPKESGLLLSDGPLLVSEIENYLDQAAPILVFLNACESTVFGRAETVMAGQDMASLAHPFITAGCGAVIGASLPVGDTQAAFFATKLYESLVSGDYLATSTWHARKSVAERFGLNDPTWSSFLLFGDGGLRVIIKDQVKQLDIDTIRLSIQQSIEWLEQERAGTGIWCDRVYRKEAPTNTAEVILAFDSAGARLKGEDLDKSILQLLKARELSYSASPYEPEGLGTFTSAVSYVLRALLTIKRWRVGVPTDGLDTEINLALLDAAQTLLALQKPEGGWSWGQRATGVGPYTLFTVEALDALEELLDNDPEPPANTNTAVKNGYDFLLKSQHADGGWGYKQDVGVSDPANTCYVLCKLLDGAKLHSDSSLIRGLAYLRRHLDLGKLNDSQFFIDHRIEVPDVPQNSWPHFEDYSGLGALCNLLLLCPTVEDDLGTAGLLQVLLKHIIDSKEAGRGWPRTYSTIYVTAYYISILASAVNFLKNANPAAKDS